MSANEEKKPAFPIVSVPIEVDQRVKITFCPLGEFPSARVNLTFADAQSGKTVRFYISGGVFKKRYEDGLDGEEETVNERLRVTTRLSDKKSDDPYVSMEVHYRLADGTKVEVSLEPESCDAIMGALQSLAHNQPHLKLILGMVTDRSKRQRVRR